MGGQHLSEVGNTALKVVAKLQKDVKYLRQGYRLESANNMRLSRLPSVEDQVREADGQPDAHHAARFPSKLGVCNRRQGLTMTVATFGRALDIQLLQDWAQGTGNASETGVPMTRAMRNTEFEIPVVKGVAEQAIYEATPAHGERRPYRAGH
ncbi:hypothetical protein FIBSPDRAFT_891106 [Athelia psychrophila]|uniref:Uncharacterized protein n=1 Tax=Athelia psychrophila TaxID=1759441 RepID=A0A166K0D7_9AGAM|nr:hypothetical protein FIBSPDRAFT_891106 [Fibularhizoctonia sp. CBS 109695]